MRRQTKQTPSGQTPPPLGRHPPWSDTPLWGGRHLAPERDDYCSGECALQILLECILVYIVLEVILLFFVKISWQLSS